MDFLTLIVFDNGVTSAVEMPRYTNHTAAAVARASMIVDDPSNHRCEGATMVVAKQRAASILWDTQQFRIVKVAGGFDAVSITDKINPTHPN